MAFAPVPCVSKKKIDKAGAILAQDNRQHEEFEWAWELAGQWRACHAYPINTFQANLRTKLKNYKEEPIAAQRLKRMPTIIDKLKRYPAMKLSTMQDIGGLRAILRDVKDVYGLTKEFEDSSRLAHELIDKKDYIQNPRNEDGYRSVHLVYKYKNRRVVGYDGLKLELQIRSKLQHMWATAVETMGTFLGQALKSRQGDQEWLDFFALVSSAFAHIENTPPIPRFSNLSKEDTFKAVAEAEKELKALLKMRGFSVAVDSIIKKNGSGKGWAFHLIILNSLKRTVQIKAYDRVHFKQAVIDYGKVEEEAASGGMIEPVLVSAGPISNLRRAYPNFFLDIEDFSKKIHSIKESARKKRI